MKYSDRFLGCEKFSFLYEILSWLNPNQRRYLLSRNLVLILSACIFFLNFDSQALAQRIGKQNQGIEKGDYVRFKFYKKTVYGKVIDINPERTAVSIGYFNENGRRTRTGVGVEDDGFRIVWKGTDPILFQYEGKREWSSKDGKQRVKAEFQKLHGDRVELLKENNKTIVVPISKLSTKDQKFLSRIKDKLDGKRVFAIGVRKEVSELYLKFLQTKIVKQVPRKTGQEIQIRTLDIPEFQFDSSKSWSQIAENVSDVDSSFLGNYRICLKSVDPYIFTGGFNHNRSAAFLQCREKSDNQFVRIGVCNFSSRQVVVSEERLKKGEKGVSISPSGKTIVTRILGGRSVYTIWKLTDEKKLRRAFSFTVNGGFSLDQKPVRMLSDSAIVIYRTSQRDMESSAYFFRISENQLEAKGVIRGVATGRRYEHNDLVISKDGEYGFWYSVKNAQINAVNLESLEPIGCMKVPVPQMTMGRDAGFWISPDFTRMVISQKSSCYGLKIERNKRVLRPSLEWTINDVRQDEYLFPYSKNSMYNKGSSRLVSGPHNSAVAEWHPKSMEWMPWEGFIKATPAYVDHSKKKPKDEIVIKEDGAFGRTKHYELIQFGRLETSAIEKLIQSIPLNAKVKFEKKTPVEVEFKALNLTESETIQAKKMIKQILGEKGYQVKEKSQFRLRFRYQGGTEKQLETFAVLNNGKVDSVKRLSVGNFYAIDLIHNGENVYSNFAPSFSSLKLSPDELDKKLAENQKFNVHRFFEIPFEPNYRYLKGNAFKKLPVNFVK